MKLKESEGGADNLQVVLVKTICWKAIKLVVSWLSSRGVDKGLVLPLSAYTISLELCPQSNVIT